MRDSAVVLHMRCDDIVIGDRRREEYGQVDELAASIARYGLLHPVVVDDRSRLVAGGRRLTAVRALGWEKIPARLLGTLTEAELREIELEENLQRKDLTSYELSKTLVALTETAAEADKEGFRVESTRNPNDLPDAAGFVEDFDTVTSQDVDDENNCGKLPHLGPREKPGSLRRVAERIGMDEKTIRRARKHIETADTFPLMQKPDWKQSHVLQAREALERLPQSERAAAVKVADQPRTHPQDVVMLLQNVTQKPAEERQEIYRLNESSDPRDKSLAQTKAAGAPPMPDPRLAILDIALDKLRATIKPYPDDPLTPRLRAVRDEVKAIKVEVEAVSFNVNRHMEGEST